MDSDLIYFKTLLQVWMVKELKISLLCLNLRMDNLYSLKMALLHTFLHLTKVSIEIYKYYSINDSFFLQMCMNNWKKMQVFIFGCSW